MARWRRALAAQLAALTAFAAVLAPAAVQAQNQVRLPSLGESSSADLSIGSERRLGDQIMREVRRDPDFLDDPVLQDYLISIWAPLVEAARKIGNIDAFTDQALAWEPFLVRERSVNAFAWPGGYVGLHLGMLAVATTRDQLASVLAHELSHVSQRHIARSIAPQREASVVAIAAMLLGVLAASRGGNPDAANAAIMGGQGAAIQGQLNFSRAMEREADRIGYNVLVAAGYSAGGMAAMFEKLDGASRLNDNGAYPYLRTHPLTTERISEARNRTLISGAADGALTLEHAVMQARARVLMDGSVQALQRLTGRTASPQLADRVGALYGAAMAAARLREPARAQSLAADALRLAEGASPREPRAERALAMLQAETRLAAGDAASALQLLDRLPPLATSQSAAATPTATAGDGGSLSSLSQAPSYSAAQVVARADRRPPLLLRAQALLELHRSDPASPLAADSALRDSTEALQTWVAEQPRDAAAWQSLSQTADALGLRLRSLRAAAEAQVALGDVNGAIDRLRAAQSVTADAARSGVPQDFIEASVIDSRMRQLVALRRQYAIEAKESP
ncbi:MAG: M48 family metalloprotease [Rubrivivax sp.]